ncbi:glycosyltransferase family 4 protein [Reinekea sp.]|jgi:glycosyltransferase involved in cell wall biosynthesis|uniref:glycosyltransferase family 4 protein n=1 Tax=Reinekea sp. TaxID=1970455 RepID=UPI0039891674
MSGFLVLFHCESNPGFAASSHEHTFLKVALHFVKEMEHVHYAYKTLKDGMSPSLPDDLTNVIELNTSSNDQKDKDFIFQYIKKHNVEFVLGFDQQVDRPLYKVMRQAGVKHFVSYWGAPISSINSPLKLIFKKIEVALKSKGPDHYVFQSDDMRKTAFLGRGIPKHKTSVIRTGIDTEKYKPDIAQSNYVFDQFNIPAERKIVFFSGHMERRKGVHIILQAADTLINHTGFGDVHFLILGNKPGQEKAFEEYLLAPNVKNHVTFGGYRKDIPNLLKGVSVGMIASTGWDSFPMSSLEIAATQVPLLVSDLDGIRETVTAETGLRFTAGDSDDAAKKLRVLLTDDNLRENLGRNGRMRVISNFSQQKQANELIAVFKNLKSER